MNRFSQNFCRTTLKFVLLFLFILGALPAFAQFQLISDSQEQDLGREMSKKVETQYGVVKNAAWTRRINAMGKRIAVKSDRPGLPYQFKVINMKEVNAFAVPGGHIYVTKGLMNLNMPDMELASVLGHEIAHAAKRHSMRSLERNLGIAMLADLLTQGKSGAMQLTAQLTQVLFDKGYSREYEYEADNAGAFYVWKAGYNPWGLIFFLDRLNKMEKGSDKNSVAQWFATHPPTDDRISRLEVQMKDLKEPRPANSGPTTTPPPKPTSKPQNPWTQHKKYH